jgi:DNA polymerase III epsilon subunit-like protein
MKIFAFDTETTGLPPLFKASYTLINLFPYIVQLSYMLFDTDSKTVFVKDNIIKMPVNVLIPEKSTEIHKITNEISAEQGKDVEDCLIDFAEAFMNADVVVAHNLSFDLNMIRVEFMRAIKNSKKIDKLSDYSKILNYLEKEYFKELTYSDTIDVNTRQRRFCTMKKTINFCNIKAKNKLGLEYIKFPTLAELHTKLFQCVPKNLHNSLNDVLVCLRCYYMLEYKTDILEINQEIKKMYSLLD